MTEPTLCIVVKGFPRVSETFITRELEQFQALGQSFFLGSLRRPAKDATLVRHAVTAPLTYLPEYLHEEPARVLRSVRMARALPGYPRAWNLFRADLKREFSRNRMRRFGQACVLASEMSRNVKHLHAHFIHTPASVARYAATMRNISYSVSAHAKDIWTTPDWDLIDKLRSAKFIAVCNRDGFARLSSLTNETNVHLWPHSPFPLDPVSQRLRAHDQSTRLLTVSRIVPKKGLDILLAALERLPPELSWSWTHIGGGEMGNALTAAVKSHRYAARMSLRGPLPHADVLAALREHDIFVLPAIVAPNGDRDGRPNALIEAMSAGMACVATRIGGIGELIDDGVNGVLVEPTASALAAALERLIGSMTDVTSLGTAARRRAEILLAEGQSAICELHHALAQAAS